jgi:antitoxin component YwqK of YwqJK toxin-antitoxin module
MRSMKSKILVSLITTIILFISGLLNAQKVLETQFNNETVYVYPYKTDVNYHADYFKAFKGSFKTNGSTKSWFIAMNNGVFDKKMYKEYKEYMRKVRGRSNNREDKHTTTRNFKKAVRLNPYPLLERKYTLDKDIIPSLDPIPDGRYVQYFDTFSLVKANGKTEQIGDRVSGIFTLKNNMLEGEALWLGMDGDTLKKGMFSKGMKVGEWMLESRRTEYALTKSNAKHYIEIGYPKMDTTIEFVSYSNGIMNGLYRRFENSKFPIEEGNFKDNVQDGEWIERQVNYTGTGSKRKRNRDNAVVTFRYTPELSAKLVKRPMIRFKQIPNLDYFYDENFTFESKYSPYIAFSRMYTLGGETEEESIELEEESSSSYEGGEEEFMDEEMYYEEEEYGYSNSYVRQRYDVNTGKYITFPELIDSLGITFNFKGIYEKRYPNGQLMVRYDFNDGSLTEEDTIYWDNGKPYDVISFEKDSAQYIQTIYDYTGLLYKQIVFDSIGEFIRVNFEPSTITYLTIDGFNAELRGPTDKYFFYDKLDTLSNVLNDSLVIFRSWFTGDTSLLYTRSYNPNDRKLDFQLISVKGTPSIDSEVIFAEDFESWTGKKHYYAGDLEVHTTSSASYVPYYPTDSFPQNHVNDFDEVFEVIEDHVLFNKGVAFSGDVKIEFGKNNFKLNAKDNKLNAQFPKTTKKPYKLEKDIRKYRATGKTKNDLLLGMIDASEADEVFGEGIFYNLFGNFISQFVEYPYTEYGYEGEYRRKRRNSYPFTEKIIGQFAAGKPTGTWKVLDQHGKLLVEIPFINGEIDGVLKTFDYQSPRELDYYMEMEPGDTFPKKTTYYLYNSSAFKNGYRNGKTVSYNWLGEVIAEENFVDGFQEGKAFERNKLAHTKLNYLQGSLDGYVKTFLTLPGKDSILLFDLNFQNGLLQGESKSFHINGNVAKRGFFLNGQPIDDYEAYDTLGFKYHYVKFQYSFPVEEKIWEENELSVRYLFDWRDSIIFEPSDITSTQSLDRILYDLGIGIDYLERPYYGRPSLIEKTGIDYHMTKYYPNDTIARDGGISKGKKVGCWEYYSYEGELLYEVDYMDSILTINDSVQFKSKGILTDFDASGNKLSESFVIEKFEKYDCSHTDHYEIRQLMTIWEAKDTVGRMNGYVKNYYDNGVLQNEGMMKDGLPTGIWKMYDPYGKLNQVGEYVMGKRNGRWLGGDLSKTKYLGDICLNPNLPNLEDEIKYREKLLDIVITNYHMGKALNKEFYDVNLNNYEEEGDESEDFKEIEEGTEEH